jgi:hypothetical protein
MDVSINKQLVSFQNFCGVIFRPCQNKIKRCFLISNVPARSVAELRVDWAWNEVAVLTEVSVETFHRVHELG